MLRTNVVWLVSCCWYVLLPFCPAAAVPDASPGGDLRDLIARYATDRAAIDRFYNLPWSELRFERLEQFYREESERLDQTDFTSLGQPGRIDYILLRNEIRGEVARLGHDRRRLAGMDALLPFRQTLLELETARRRMESVDPQASASQLAALPEQIKKLRERIERGKPVAAPLASGPTSTAATAPETAPAADDRLSVSATTARRAAEAVSALRGTLNEWFSFFDGYKPDFSWWVRKPYEELGAALDEYAKYLRESVAGLKGADDDPLVGEPVGGEVLADEIVREMLPYTAEELIAIGERAFAWCEEEMKKAAADMGFGTDWKAALAKVKEGYVPPGEQDELVTGLAREVIGFLKARDLLTIPPLCEETWRITMISPETQKVLPFAAYGGQHIMIAYPTDAMKHEDKLAAMRGNNRHFSRSVTAHELIPGHHLQAFMTERNRPYRQVFSTPFFVEGWALYWEMRLWDLGFAKTPEDRMGMLFWRMHRAARIVVSLKFHLGQMTPKEMVDFLVERVGHERFGATSEVRRFIAGDYAPLYQCGYMIGGLQLRALQDELVGSGRMSERKLHDAVLTYGAIPIELIRAGLLDRPLTRDSESEWKFAGDRPGP